MGTAAKGSGRAGLSENASRKSRARRTFSTSAAVAEHAPRVWGWL